MNPQPTDDPKQAAFADLAGQVHAGEADTAADEVGAILAAGGFAPMPAGEKKGLYTQRDGRGWWMGGQHESGTIYSKHTAMSTDTTDDPIQAAHELVALANKNPLTTEATLDPIIAQAEALAPQAEAGESLGDADAPTEQPSALDDAAGSAASADAGSGADEGDLSDPDGADFHEPGIEPIDAEFTASEPPVVAGDDNLNAPALEDLGADIVAAEEETSGVAYFGDDFPTMRLKKIGRLAQIASEMTAGLLAHVNWSDAEYASVQSHVVTNMDKATGAYTGDRQDIFNRFVELSEAQAAVNTINRHRDQSIEYLNAADTPRALIESFDPEAGWP